MNTLYALLLITSLNGREDVDVVDRNLTLVDCYQQLGQRINLPGGNFVTLECRYQGRGK